MMLAQISERESRFIDSLVERSAAFRQRVEAFSVGLVESTKAFLRQLVPQPPPEPMSADLTSSRRHSAVARGRRGSVRVAVLKQEARKVSGRPVSPRRGSSSRAGSDRQAGRKGSSGRKESGQEG